MVYGKEYEKKLNESIDEFFSEDRFEHMDLKQIREYIDHLETENKALDERITTLSARVFDAEMKVGELEDQYNAN